MKQLWRMVENPVYAGANPEKWTQGKPEKCAFPALVSYKLFNAANRGKVIITENAEGVHIYRQQPPAYLVNKGAKNSEFPFKRIVMCSMCRNPLYGSASKGKLKYYPVYHCCHRGHHFRKPKPEFDAAIEAFVKNIKVSKDYVDALREGIGKAFDRQLMETHKDAVTIDLRLTQLRSQIRQAVDKIKFLSSETAIKYMEEDIVKLEAEVNELEQERQKSEPQKPTDMDKVNAYVSYYLAHLDELLLHYGNPVLQARYFGVIFN